jgi:hypothetical protein
MRGIGNAVDIIRQTQRRKNAKELFFREGKGHKAKYISANLAFSLKSKLSVFAPLRFN